MPRIWPIRHCVCHPVWKLPHWMPVVRPPLTCFPSRRIKNLKRLCSCMQYSILLFIAILLALLIGKNVEENHVERARSTMDLYNKSEVCALMGVPDYLLNTSVTQGRQRSSTLDDSNAIIKTIANVTVARSTPNTLVAHCGDCGKCSTPSDVKIYDETKNTLTDTTTKCAKLGLIGGRRRATKCMQERTGLSEGCIECWVDNILCSIKSCVFTCLWRQLTSWGDEKSVGGELNDCTRCDELRCGRGFLMCAGANRRRTGIVSDIERDHDQEVCNDADEEFWQSEQVRLWYQSVTRNTTASTSTGEPESRLLRGLSP